MSSVLVTGASGCIGKAIAIAVAEAGYAVVAHYRSNQQAVDELVGSVTTKGGVIRLLQFDISDREQTRTVLEQDINDNEAYYGIICNAGIHADGAFPALSEEDWDSVMRTNLDGFYNVVQPLTMPMIQRRKSGRIITISSVSGLMGNRGQVNYSASKAGLIGATKALAIELAKRKITVNCIAPGVIETEMVDEHVREQAMPMIPMQRFGKAEEVASLVNYLLSEQAAYITRQVISVNGGMF